MAEELDEIKDLPSSEQETLDVAEAPAKVVEADASSSNAADETPKDTLSVVRDVVDERKAKTEEPGSSPEAEEDGSDPAEAVTKKPDDTDYTDVPFHKHPRFQHLLREKKAAEVDAIRYRNVETFLQRSNLDAAEAADGLEIMGLAKVDPVAAWQRIKPWVEKVLVAAGEIIPQDLQQRIQAGEMTREAAMEVSRARAQVSSVTERQKLQEQQAQQREREEAGKALTDAASSWEADRRLKDPNFDAKVLPIQEKLAYWNATEGRPTTPEGVLERCQRAYKAVNAAFRPPAPVVENTARRPAVRPVTGGQVAGSAVAEPKSTLDIVRANRRSG
jgi:hypothetical protein